MLLRLTSWRAGACCIQHTNKSGPSALASRSIASSADSLTGGPYVTGMSVSPQGRALPRGNDRGLKRRPSRLDCNDRFDQPRPGVGDQPAEGAGLRVGQHNRRPDLVEQRCARILIALLRLFVRYDGLDLGGVERVEDRIALLALVRPFSRPLRVLLRLRPGAVGLDRGKLKLLALGGEHAGRPVAGMPGRATAHWLIDHVDDVALLYEILGPSLAPIRRAHPVGRGLSGAVD